VGAPTAVEVFEGRQEALLDETRGQLTLPQRGRSHHQEPKASSALMGKITTNEHVVAQILPILSAGLSDNTSICFCVVTSTSLLSRISCIRLIVPNAL
jgi:hypothetical protein